MGQRKRAENISADMCVYIFCLRMLRVTSSDDGVGWRVEERRASDVRGRIRDDGGSEGEEEKRREEAKKERKQRCKNKETMNDKMD